VSADLLTDFLDRFVPGLQVVVTAGESRRTLCVETARFHKGRVLLKFEGVDSISAAETFRNALVQVPKSERIPLPPGQVYISDLMGCSVEEQEETLGSVVGWQETGGVPLLLVDSDGVELLIPYTPEICYAVNVAARQILVRTPKGLRQLKSTNASRRKRDRRKKR
jgi:16S rRNA processing protein RimM